LLKWWGYFSSETVMAMAEEETWESQQEPVDEAEEVQENVEMAEVEGPKGRKRGRPHVPCHNLMEMFHAKPSEVTESQVSSPPIPSPARAGVQNLLTLSGFHLKVSSVEASEAGLVDADAEGVGLERRIYGVAVPLKHLTDAVMLLEASIPLKESGKAIFRTFPQDNWLDITGNNSALGTRCLFASRRHEQSVLGAVEQFLQIPSAAKEEQLPLIATQESVVAQLGDKEQSAWILQIHPGEQLLRVIVRPGALLLRMLRRGNLLPAARFAWRLRDSTETEVLEAKTTTSVGEFSILSNFEDGQAKQPPNFEKHPLRPEQLRSLGWMLKQEKPEKEAFVTELRDFETCPDAAHWRLEGSLRCEYLDVRGGVLADAIGYGKTACTIGLIDTTKELPMPRVPMPYRGFVPSRATLVLAPSNLQGQWVEEIKKFTGSTLKVLSIPTISQLKKYTMKELTEADVVVATYRLFYSKPYLTRLEELTREVSLGFTFPNGGGAKDAGSDWSKAYRHAFEALPRWCARKLGLALEGEESRKRRRLIGKQRSQAFSQEEQMALLEEISFVPLEVFWWRRVVCDEFHELLSKYPPAQVAVELFHADYKWGLSGTPPCSTLAKIRKAAGFLGVQLPHGSHEEREEERKVAQEWLDAFVRRNTADLPVLEEEEHILEVNQTPKERHLYLALTKSELSITDSQAPAGDMALELPDVTGLKDIGRTRTDLLKLCSHFCISRDSEVVSAEEECQRQLELRRRGLKAAERDVKALADKAVALVQLIQHFEPFFGRSSLPEHCEYLKSATKASLMARAKFLNVKDPAKDKTGILQQLLSAAEKYSSSTRTKVLNRFFESKGCGRPAKDADQKTGEAERAWRQLMVMVEGEESQDCAAIECLGTSAVRQAIQEALAACGSEPPARCFTTRKSLGMPGWPNEDKSLLEENWTWMGVKANAQKLQDVLASWKVDMLGCAERLEQLKVDVSEKTRDLESFQDSLQATQAQQQPEHTEHEGSQFAKYGSKIELLVKHVQKLQSEDSTAKMICFVQWEDLKRKISKALKEFQVDHVTLHGGVWTRQSVLRRFQYEGGPRMLLLSLEESASGTNLTAANHVLIVHPMEAESSDEAVAFEMQAVGRVRRPGQEKKIHIWRFVTCATIEETITQEHQKELWERQQAGKIEPSLPAGQAADAASDGEDGEEVSDSAEAEGENVGVDEVATQCYDVNMSNGIQASRSQEKEHVFHNEITPSSTPKEENTGDVDMDSTQCYAA